MHANYLSPQFAARAEIGLRNAENQLNFFTLPHFATLKAAARLPRFASSSGAPICSKHLRSNSSRETGGDWQTPAP